MFLVSNDRCNGCGVCIEVCPQGAMELREDKAIISQELCDGCGSCLEACARGAIYEVKVPTVVPEPTPATIPPRSTATSTRRTGLAATMVGLAPVAMDALFGLARRWLAAREERTGMPGTRLGVGVGRRRRRRGGRR